MSFLILKNTMATAITPRALHKGDAIAFISPSARLNHTFPAPLHRAKTYLEHLGYHVKVTFNKIAPKSFRDAVI